MLTLIVLLVLMMTGAPLIIAICFSAMFFTVQSGNTVLFDSLPQQLFNGIDNYGLVAFPLFMIVGEIMNVGGITKRLFQMATAFMGRIRGGLAYVNLIANVLLAAILGSATAQTAIMAKLMVPEMEKRGYTRSFAVGVTVSGGLLSPIIPPSIMFVVYGVMAQVPIGDMFIAGILPGVLLASSIALCIFGLGLLSPLPREPEQSWNERLKNLAAGLPAMSIPVAITGSIATGFASPTESAAFSALIAWFVARWYGTRLSMADLWRIMVRSGILSALVLLLVAGAAVFSWVLIYGKVPQTIAAWIQSVAHSPLTFMLWVNLILLVIGAVFEGVPALIMTVPILLPIATQVYGIDPVYFGVVVSINVVLGLAHPPIGLVLFVAAAATGMKPGEVFKATLPYAAAALVVLLCVTAFPWLSLALVRH